MPIPHLNIRIVQRSKGSSAVAGAAYQAGEKLFSEYDQKNKDHRRKQKEVVYTEIMLPANAPPEYADRETLWNSAEEVEKQWNSQLARRFVVALPREVPLEMCPQMLQEYCEEYFVSKGMCCDIAIHDPDPPGHNPHCHIMLTMRAIDENGKWMPKSRKSILISCGARLAPFDIRELRELMETDEMELDTLGDRKTALFVIISDTDDTFNFVVSILYTQLFNLLCDKADDVYGGRLPVHVRCLLDEFANIGQIPKFEKLIATIRSREISASIILQSQSQLKAIYKDNADTIVGNCDTTLFLGGKEKTTLKEISEILGKETIDSFNTSETRGRELSHGLNYQKLGKDMPYLFVKSSVALNLS